MTSTTGENHDTVRTAIQAAMDRLLAGTPLRSTGRLSVSQLALEAGVKRWYLTHQHLDLKELFQARVKAANHAPEAFAKRLGELELLKKKHADLLKYTAELEERMEIYAASINLLSQENTVLAGQLGAAARVVPIRGAGQPRNIHLTTKQNT
jgi:hypothetical protein